MNRGGIKLSLICAGSFRREIVGNCLNVVQRDRHFSVPAALLMRVMCRWIICRVSTGKHGCVFSETPSLLGKHRYKCIHSGRYRTFET
jgi:hypothetical protein